MAGNAGCAAAALLLTAVVLVPGACAARGLRQVHYCPEQSFLCRSSALPRCSLHRVVLMMSAALIAGNDEGPSHDDLMPHMLVCKVPGFVVMSDDITVF
jgi:hypothetical protein